VHKKGLKPHLLIIGEGEERENLLHQITQAGLPSYVHLLGYVNNASCILPAFDIFALPSHKEGLPYVLMEAGQASLPVVVSNIHGIKDIITHEKTGLMVQAEAQTFADALTTLLTNKVLAEEYGKALHAHVTKNFSIERMVTETSALY
jgi:glycosyltransferase involved in cell wall biosynthesis